MSWIDLILPYRFWLKNKYVKAAKSIEADFLPKSYNPSLLIPAYRKKIKEINKLFETLGFSTLIKIKSDIINMETSRK